MAIVGLGSKNQNLGGNGGTTSAAVDTTGANLIVITIGSGTDITITDSEGNTYTTAVARTGSTFGGRARIAYVYNPTTSASHTWTASGSGEAVAICVRWYSGAASSPLDQTNSSQGSGGTRQPGSITPSEDNCLVVTGVGVFTVSTATIDSGYTVQGTLVGSSSFSWGMSLADIIQTTATATNPTWTVTDGTGGYAGVIASFKAAAGGGSSASPSVSPSASASPSASVSPSASPSQSPSASVSPSVSPSASPSTSPSASVSPSISPSVPAGGDVKVWMGSSWVVKPMYVWNGSTWELVTT